MGDGCVIWLRNHRKIYKWMSGWIYKSIDGSMNEEVNKGMHELNVVNAWMDK